jgi:hypothetical protein
MSSTFMGSASHFAILSDTADHHLALTALTAGRQSVPCARQDGLMDTTGWIAGQLFLQTVDDGEVAVVSEFLNARGIAFQVLTLSERMTLDPAEPDQAVTTDRYSIAVQLGGFPQVVGPVLNELIQRSHGGGWQGDIQV